MEVLLKTILISTYVVSGTGFILFPSMSSNLRFQRLPNKYTQRQLNQPLSIGPMKYLPVSMYRKENDSNDKEEDSANLPSDNEDIIPTTKVSPKQLADDDAIDVSSLPGGRAYQVRQEIQDKLFKVFEDLVFQPPTAKLEVEEFQPDDNLMKE